MKVLYFAQASTAAGCREEIWPVTVPLSLDEFWTEATRRHPDLAALKSQCRVANGMEYVGSDGLLDPGSETAVIPPVSGG